MLNGKRNSVAASCCDEPGPIRACHCLLPVFTSSMEKSSTLRSHHTHIGPIASLHRYTFTNFVDFLSSNAPPSNANASVRPNQTKVSVKLSAPEAEACGKATDGRTDRRQDEKGPARPVRSDPNSYTWPENARDFVPPAPTPRPRGARTIGASSGSEAARPKRSALPRCPGPDFALLACSCVHVYDSLPVHVSSSSAERSAEEHGTSHLT